jgi:GAF domain-containing protein
MLTAFRNFFTSPVYIDDPEQTQDALTAHRVGLALLILGVVPIPFIFALESPIREFALYDTLGGLIFWLIAIFLVQRGRRTAAKLIYLTVNTLNLFAVVYATGGLERSTIFITLFLLALANLLFPARGVIVYGAVLLVSGVGFYVLSAMGLTPPPAYPETYDSNFRIFFFTVLSVFFVMTIASINYQRSLQVLRKNESELRARNTELDQLRGSLEARVAERTRQVENRAYQLDAISSVARSIASIQDLEELLPSVADLVGALFDYYHIGIFLPDDAYEYVVLRATNSSGGRKLLERQYKLKYDSSSVVGYAISRGESRVAMDRGTDAFLLKEPELQDTRSEIALPLRIGGRLIGVLDIQSVNPNAFAEDNFTMLSILADQIAIAIENARLFSEARKALSDSEKTIERYVGQEWSAFIRQVKSSGYMFDGNRTVPIAPEKQREKIKPLAQTGRLSLGKETAELAIPIRLRGQTVGVLDVKSKKGARQWTRDEIILLESAAERAALALENARLVESAQRRAARERTIGEISNRIGAVSDLESIMQTVVEELGRRIGGTEVVFELDVDHEPEA